VHSGLTIGAERRKRGIKRRWTPAQRDPIDRASRLLGKSSQDFMLEAACERARVVVVDQVFFRLDGGQFQQFAALLDSAPMSHPRSTGRWPSCPRRDDTE
jgi:uncharacterized protein (DUF1778 family)